MLIAERASKISTTEPVARSSIGGRATLFVGLRRVTAWSTDTPSQKFLNSGRPAGRQSTSVGYARNFSARELTAPDGAMVPLTTAEFRLLGALVISAQRPLDRDHLLGLVAEREWTPYDRSVDVLIGKLRQKIEPDRKIPTLIKTERGVPGLQAG